ncbi:hypothetical protein TUM3794_20850 [Shewanella colwelliana]|uniref:C2H2-type domain-containing protein n=1 Tax=Shewanella colwelliana TaxID=23 RepID=A0ABQ4P0S1_SHECO|nr:hypothetical protein [Shewanella colwelliana]GIU41114.1 hypothetical protein TUM3794_20850 [Shewanella colwelliana]
MTDNKQDWARFFEYEKSLLHKLNENSECLANVPGNEPTYLTQIVNGKLREKAPRYIRWIGRTSLSESEINHDIAMLKNLYLKASGYPSEDVVFPERFPQFYESIDRITLSTFNAYSSRALKQDEPVQISYQAVFFSDDETDVSEVISEYEEYKASLIEFGLLSADYTIENYEYHCAFSLTVHGDELFNHFDAMEITARSLTGQQYIANVACDPCEPSFKTNYGFILTHSQCHVSAAPRRKPRKDALERCADRLSLPVATAIEFWKKA